MTCLLPLSRGQVAQVDAADYPALLTYRWYLVSGGYAARWQPTHAGQSLVLLHRHLLNPLPHQLVDHINGDPLDNRRANLRLVDAAQNQWNRQPNAGCQYKGVSWHPRKAKWQVRIRAQRRRYFLGYYADPILAAQIYDAASRLLHGDYAHLNFPDQLPSDEVQTRVLAYLSRAGGASE